MEFFLTFWTFFSCFQTDLGKNDCHGFTVWLGAFVRAAVEMQEAGKVSFK